MSKKIHQRDTSVSLCVPHRTFPNTQPMYQTVPFPAFVSNASLLTKCHHPTMERHMAMEAAFTQSIRLMEGFAQTASQFTESTTSASSATDQVIEQGWGREVLEREEGGWGGALRHRAHKRAITLSLPLALRPLWEGAGGGTAVFNYYTERHSKDPANHRTHTHNTQTHNTHTTHARDTHTHAGHTHTEPSDTDCTGTRHDQGNSTRSECSLLVVRVVTPGGAGRRVCSSHAQQSGWPDCRCRTTSGARLHQRIVSHSKAQPLRQLSSLGVSALGTSHMRSALRFPPMLI